MSVRVVAAAEVAHADHAALWTEAFSDYFTPGSFTAESLAGFERAFDLDRAGSRIVIEDERLVAFAMLGIRGARGWVGGMGVIPSARRRGHGERVMAALLEAGRERGLTTVGLEVLTQNAPAIPLYEKLGFRTTRLLEVWDRAADAPAPPAPARAAEPISLDEAARWLGNARLAAAPWQRELGAARAAFPDLEALVHGDAVAILRAGPERVGLLELGPTADAAPDGGEASLDALLAAIFSAHTARPSRVLNLPEGDPAAPALARAGFAVSHRQWEMVRG